MPSNRFSTPSSILAYEMVLDVLSVRRVGSEYHSSLLQVALEFDDLIEQECATEKELTATIQRKRFKENEAAILLDFSITSREIAADSGISLQNCAKLRHSGIRGSRPQMWRILLVTKPPIKSLDRMFKLYGFSKMGNNLGDFLVQKCIEKNISMQDLQNVSDFLSSQNHKTADDRLPWSKHEVKGFLPQSSKQEKSLTKSEINKARETLKLLKNFYSQFKEVTMLEKRRINFVREKITNDPALSWPGFHFNKDNFNSDDALKNFLQDKSGLPDLNRSLKDGYSVNSSTFYRLAISLFDFEDFETCYELFGQFPKKDNFCDRLVCSCIKAKCMKKITESVNQNNAHDYPDACETFWYFLEFSIARRSDRIIDRYSNPGYPLIRLIDKEKWKELDFEGVGEDND